MGTRLELQAKLEELLGSKNVYFNPPNGLKMKYPAIVYNRDTIDISRADDKAYRKTNRYGITYISTLPTNTVIDALLELPMCSYDRQFVSDGLYHDTCTLYF